MGTAEVRQKYLDFFKARGHVEVPSSSLVPEDDPTTLFTGSGMQPLLAYFLGKPHPLGKRITDSQKCFRTVDIDEVGDNRHTTVFEMLGNWSFGDYFKREQLNWFFAFLIDELGLEPSRLYATVFRGYGDIPRDEETVTILKEIYHQRGVETKAVVDAAQHGLQGGRIFYYGADKNWWSRAGSPDQMPVGEPGGPTSEVFYDFGPEHQLHQNSPFADEPCHPNCDCGRFLEIGNSVFMTYEKVADGSLRELPRKNIDFGGGLERIVAVTINSPDIFQIDSFKVITQTIEQALDVEYSGENKPRMRIIADHLKGATFLIADGVRPSNKEQGYYLRRLLRRAVTQFYLLNGDLAPIDLMAEITQRVTRFYGSRYFKARPDSLLASRIIAQEVSQFNRALQRGLREIDKHPPEQIDAEFAFHLYQSYGLPFEITEAVLAQRGYKISRRLFDAAYTKHQKVSRQGVAQKFRSGLANHSRETIKLHTATHLLHQALRDVLGKQVQQKGSNITAKRLRFDFSLPRPLTPAEVAQVESIVNAKIKDDLPVEVKELPYEQALAEGALAVFAERYPPIVTVYTIGDYSREVCRGPHVSHTGELGKFRILKEESVGRGVRRIRAILENN